MRRIIFALILVLFIVGCGSNNITGNVVLEGATQANSCEDTDNGVDTATKGAVSGIDNGAEYEKEDICLAGLLVEYYCEDNKPVNQNIRCDNECSKGACV